MMKKLVAYGSICLVLACVGYGAKLLLDGDSLDTEYWLTLVALAALLPMTLAGYFSWRKPEQAGDE
tara:strand:+ start:286 stop:483 length:198 start_codon:yes stop_codon:yes gene_type:complete